MSSRSNSSHLVPFIASEPSNIWTFLRDPPASNVRAYCSKHRHDLAALLSSNFFIFFPRASDDELPPEDHEGKIKVRLADKQDMTSFRLGPPPNIFNADQNIATNAGDAILDGLPAFVDKERRL